MSGNRTRLLFVLAWLSATAPALARGPAVAEPPSLESGAADVSEAREAFLRGSALAKAGDWEAALLEFQRSAELKPHPVTTYDIAYCERALGRYAHASVHFAEALAAPVEEGAPTLPRELSREATKYRDEVELRVARVAITLRPADLTLRVDGSGVVRAGTGAETPYLVAGPGDAPAALPSGPVELWLDPGDHVFVATGAAGARATANRTLAAGERANVVLTATAVARPSEPAHPVEPAPPPRPLTKPDRTLAYVVFGVAGLGLVTSATFAGLALAEKHSLDVDGACTGRQCPQAYADRESRMRTFADVATVGIVTFGVGAAVGTYLYLSAKPRPAKAGWVAPWFTGNAAGIAGRF